MLALSRKVKKLFDAVLTTLLLLLAVALKVVHFLLLIFLENALKIVLWLLLFRLAFDVLTLLIRHVR